MRLQEMYFLCKTALGQWETPNIIEQKRGQQVVDYLFENLGAVNETLRVLEPIPMFHDKIVNFHSLNERLDYGKTRAAIDLQLRTEAIRRLSNIESQLETICEVAESMGYNDTLDGIDVKFPDGLSLDEFAKMTSKLSSVLAQCPTLQFKDASFQLKGVDRGSTWLSFAVIGGAAVALFSGIAALVDKAIMIRSHIATCKQQESQVRQLEDSEQLLHTIIEANKETTKLLVAQVAKEMAEEHGITDPEAIGRQQYALKELTDMMSKGLEIYAAINSAPEVKAVFPPLERQRISEAELKLLEKKSDTELPVS